MGSSNNRNVTLVFQDWKGIKTTAEISYNYPKGRIIIEDTLVFPRDGMAIVRRPRTTTYINSNGMEVPAPRQLGKKAIINAYMEGKLSAEALQQLLNEPKGKGQIIIEDTLKFTQFGDKAEIKVYESPEELDSPKANPFAKAGFLIKTEGAILDIQLFKFENEKAGLYFFGEIFCQGIANGLKQGEQGLVDPNRAGLDWKHPYCLMLQAKAEEFLAPYIDKKKKELEKGPETKVSEQTKKALGNLCNLLNKLAKEELEPFNPLEIGYNIEEFMIKPEFAHLEIGLPRGFSVYVPHDLWPLLDKGDKIEISSNNPNIQILDSVIETSELSTHPKHAELLYGRFGVIGNIEDEKANITCKIGENFAHASVMVAEPDSGKKKKYLGGKQMGFFSQIEPDEMENPLQRVLYKKDNASICIFVKFPVVNMYLKAGLQGIETKEGKILLAELVGEAFCREIARKRIEMGKDPQIPGSEIDSFNSIVNELQRKYLHKIHEALVK